MNISYNYNLFSNRYSEQYLNRKKSKNKFQSFTLNSSFYSKEKLNSDQYIKNIAFTSSVPDIHLVNAIQSIFDRSIVFGPKEYKNLSKQDFSILTNYQKHFLADKDNNSAYMFITKFGKLFSEQLQSKYPKGLTFVSVGRSPACLAKYLEFKGEDVKYCPISNMHTFIIEEFSPQLIKSYKKFLNSIGLTKEKVKSADKHIIITDYTFDGYSLENFKRLLELPEIGIVESDKVKFCPITLNHRFNKENSIFNHDPYDIYSCKWSFSDADYIDNMEYEKTKEYTSIPYIDIRRFGDYEEELLNKYYQNENRFEEDFNTKMMNFLIADNIMKTNNL